MRILQLRFKNLNSLVGEWELDFTDPAYLCDGVFAITGPTGAGKTTLLDAICLALYGRTPRLRLSKANNELMSRLTADCFAEVKFETLKGRFCCYWSQHRSRKKLDGELQLPRHEIADLDSGQVLESSLRGVQERVELVTGMDFERFVRSMLLAQGDFAAFLKADADARSPILEQITGTEIYSDISKQVYLRYSEEREQLRQLQAALDGLALLSPEQQQVLQQQLAALELQQQDLQLVLQQQQRLVLLWQQYQQLLQTQQQLEADQLALSAQQQDFLPQRQLLRRALAALELSKVYGALQQQRWLLQQTEQQWQAAQQDWPALQQAEQQAQAEQQWRAQQQQALKQQYQCLLPNLQQARQLDVLLQEKQQQLKPLVRQLAQLGEDLARGEQQQQLAQQQREQALLQQQQLLARQQQTAQDADLQGVLPEVQVLLKQWQRLLQQSDQLLGQQHSLQQEKQQQLGLQAQLEQQYQQQQTQQQALQQQLARAEQQLTQQLAGRSWLEWLQLYQQKQQQWDSCLRLQNELELWMQDQRQYDELLQQNEHQQQALQVLQLQLDHGLAQLLNLQQQLHLLEQNVLLLRQIEHLTELRHSLVDGEVCPLCGALEHPFAQDLPPRPELAQQQLQSLRQQIQQQQLNCQQWQQQVTTLQQQYRWGQQQQPLLLQQLIARQQLLAQGLESLGLSEVVELASVPLCELALAQLEQQLIQQLALDQQLLADCERQQQLIAELQQASQLQQQQQQTLQLARQQQAHQLALLEQQGQQWQQLQQQLAQQRPVLQQQLQQLLSDFVEGSLAWEPEGLDAVWLNLQQRHQAWQQRAKQLSQLEQQLAQLEQQVAYLQYQQQQGQQQHQQLSEQQTVLLQQQQDLLQHRAALQLSASPDQLEADWQQQLNQAEQQLNQAQQSWQQAQQALVEQRSGLEKLQQQAEQQRAELLLQQENWQQQLSQQEFVDEADYVGACLPENERRQLVLQQQTLDEQATGLLSQQHQLQQQLTQLQSSLPAEFEPQQQLEQQQLWLAQQQTIQQQAGVIRHQLQQHELTLQSQQQQLQRLQQQRQQAEVWDLLQQLIGSADGKKYRNFAQGLTFEVMVYFANVQLQSMSERYLLVRDKQQPLELNVIDNYQGGEIRSTKNLSGGESFIVSLALALGLSQMASKNVRIDSLFLDEGFGTLDEDALETALDTLANLQQQGKLIGVISHVSALKERIQTQIHLLPQSNGCSRLEGPGCHLRSAPLLLRMV